MQRAIHIGGCGMSGKLILGDVVAEHTPFALPYLDSIASGHVGNLTAHTALGIPCGVGPVAMAAIEWSDMVEVADISGVAGGPEM